MERPFLLAVMGATSSGKTALAEELASKYSAQLVNADAFQVYRGFDIGTGKPADHSRYLLMDVAEPTYQFGLGEWVQMADAELKGLWEEQRSAVLVGGTGLYIRALMEEYQDLSGMPDPELRKQLMDEEREQGSEALFVRLEALRPDLAARVVRSNPLRVRRALEVALSPSASISFKLPPFQKMKIGLDIPAEELAVRIESRVKGMLEGGWIEEVEAIRSSGVPYDAPAMSAIGYRQIWDYLEGNVNLEEATEKIVTVTRQYAKRQRTWLRSEPNIRMVNSSFECGEFEVVAWTF